MNRAFANKVKACYNSQNTFHAADFKGWIWVTVLLCHAVYLCAQSDMPVYTCWANNLVLPDLALLQV